jgi:hypothetical protein
MTKGIKKSNTETFIMANRQYIAVANKNLIAEIKNKMRLQKFKEDALKWRNILEKKKEKAAECHKVKSFSTIISNLIKLI